MVKGPVYTADENPEKREALRLFAKEGVVSKAHKKLVQKYRIASGRGGFWVITDEAKAHAELLGFLD